MDGRKLTTEDRIRYACLILVEGILWIISLITCISMLIYYPMPWVPPMCGPGIYLCGVWSMRIKRLSGDFISRDFTYIYKAYAWICRLDDEESPSR